MQAAECERLGLRCWAVASFILLGAQVVDEAEAGGPAAVLKQQLKSLDALVAERVDAVLAARGWKSLGIESKRILKDPKSSFM